MLEVATPVLLQEHQVHNFGIHECLPFAVSQPAGFLWRVATRFVFFAEEPVITGVNFTANPRIGDSFFIECIFNGMPIPESVTWGKDGEELSEIYNNVKIVPTDHSSRLEVTQATIMDNGIYECNISNIAGFASRQFPVKLQEGQLALYSYHNIVV